MKIRKFVLTESGLVRKPELHEYYLHHDLPHKAGIDWKELPESPIMSLEIIFTDWKPKKDAEYYIIETDSTGQLCVMQRVCRTHDGTDKTRIEQCNCFPDFESANKKLQEVLNLLREDK